MQSSRQRVERALTYRSPDRIPVFYHPSTAGLYTHGQRLLDLLRAHPCDNPISFDSIPRPELQYVDSQGRYHELKKDEWGVTWEYRIFGLQGHPHTCPFASWDEAVRSYRFPQALDAGHPGFGARRREVAGWTKDYFVHDGWVTLIMQMYALYPMEQLLMDLMDGDTKLEEFLALLVGHWQRVIRGLLDSGVDAVMFADDWSTQTGPMVPREMYQRLFAPHYQELMKPIKEAGKRVYFHICGRAGYMLDELEALGVDLIWPQIACYEPHADFARRLKDHRMSTYIHPDRQYLVPRGTPAEIEQKIAEYAEIHHKLGGGAIFWIEIENDAPFENVKALIEAVHRYR